MLALRLTDVERDEGIAFFLSSLSPSTCSFKHAMISSTAALLASQGQVIQIAAYQFLCW